VKYSKEKTVLISSWIVMILLLIRFVPKHRMREAHVPFLFKQLMTWIFGLTVVQLRLIRYPYRLFKKAYKASFSFEYFLYPALCSLFNLYYPEKRSNLIKALYYMTHCSIISIIEFFLEKYTKLIQYQKWKWYYTFITLWITYYASRVYSRWFFKGNTMSKGQ
jgi:hypothetical protein